MLDKSVAYLVVRDVVVRHTLDEIMTPLGTKSRTGYQALYSLRRSFGRVMFIRVEGKLI